MTVNIHEIVENEGVFEKPASNKVRKPVIEGEGMADRLRKALVGKTRSQIIKASGVSDGTITRALRGLPTRWRTLASLAEALNVSVDWLVNDYGPMHPPSHNYPTREVLEELEKQPDPPEPEKTTPLFGTLDIKRMATAIDIAEDAFAKRQQNPSSFRRAQVFLTLYDALATASPNKVRELIHLWDMEDLQQTSED